MEAALASEAVQKAIESRLKEARSKLQDEVCRERTSPRLPPSARPPVRPIVLAPAARARSLPRFPAVVATAQDRPPKPVPAGAALSTRHPTPHPPRTHQVDAIIAAEREELLAAARAREEEQRRAKEELQRVLEENQRKACTRTRAHPPARPGLASAALRSAADRAGRPAGWPASAPLFSSRSALGKPQISDAARVLLAAPVPRSPGVAPAFRRRGRRALH